MVHLNNMQELESWRELSAYLEVQGAVEIHGKQSPNISQWHTDYFEFKVLEKQPVQEGHLDPPLSP